MADFDAEAEARASIQALELSPKLAARFRRAFTAGRDAGLGAAIDVLNQRRGSHAELLKRAVYPHDAEAHGAAVVLFDRAADIVGALKSKP